MISLSSNSNAHSLDYSFDFSSEGSSKKSSFNNVSNRSTEPKKQQTQTKKEIRQEKREQKKAVKTQRKELKKTLWKTIKEQRKISKDRNSENGIKEKKAKIHWAAHLSFFSALAGIGSIAAAIIFETVSVLMPVLIVGLLLLSVVMAIVGISAVASKNTTVYHKSHTITLALIGGIISFLALLLIGLIVFAISVAFG